MERFVIHRLSGSIRTQKKSEISEQLTVSEKCKLHPDGKKRFALSSILTQLGKGGKINPPVFWKFGIAVQITTGSVEIFDIIGKKIIPQI